MTSKNYIKQLSRLSTKKGRNENGLYLIEGLRIIRSALRAQAIINRIFVTEKFKKSVADGEALPKCRTWTAPTHDIRRFRL